MKVFIKQGRRVWLGGLGIGLCVALGVTAAAQAQEITPKTLVDRAQIQDLITRYYYNFGKEKPESFPDFYADDAELILGTTHYKGKDGIAKAYSRPATSSSPVARAYAFTVTISNPLIVVHGTTASSKVIFTEFVVQKEGDPLRLTTQGREYATFVKVNGQWRYKTRQIKGGTEPPDDWRE